MNFGAGRSTTLSGVALRREAGIQRVYRAGHPPRFARWCTPKCAATSPGTRDWRRSIGPAGGRPSTSPAGPASVRRCCRGVRECPRARPRSRPSRRPKAACVVDSVIVRHRKPADRNREDFCRFLQTELDPFLAFKHAVTQQERAADPAGDATLSIDSRAREQSSGLEGEWSMSPCRTNLKLGLTPWRADPLDKLETRADPLESIRGLAAVERSRGRMEHGTCRTNLKLRLTPWTADPLDCRNKLETRADPLERLTPWTADPLDCRTNLKLGLTPWMTLRLRSSSLPVRRSGPGPAAWPAPACLPCRTIATSSVPGRTKVAARAGYIGPSRLP